MLYIQKELLYRMRRSLTVTNLKNFRFVTVKDHTVQALERDFYTTFSTLKPLRMGLERRHDYPCVIQSYSGNGGGRGGSPRTTVEA